MRAGFFFPVTPNQKHVIRNSIVTVVLSLKCHKEGADFLANKYSYKMSSTNATSARPVRHRNTTSLSVPSDRVKLWEGVGGAQSHIMCHRGQRRPFALHTTLTSRRTINILGASWLSEENSGQASCKSPENGSGVIDMTVGDRREIAALSK